MGLLDDLIGLLKDVYDVLEELGYRPVIVGTFALILQKWIPSSYIYVTKDIDIYSSDPMIAFDHVVEERIYGLGLAMGRSDAGGIYIDTRIKPIEIVYPIHDFYIPAKLLDEIIVIRGMRVLEGHAVLVAKALVSSIDYLAPITKSMGIHINVERLNLLAINISKDIDRSSYDLLLSRIRSFIKKYSSGGSVYED